MNKLVGNGLKALKKKPITDALGFVMYEGPSVLDGAPIVVIATMKSGNTKTGNMVQVWIIRSDMHPVTASKVGADEAICGSCAHRHYNGGACYVNLGQAPAAVYRAYLAGKYKKLDLDSSENPFAGRMVRLGAYGDPAAAPFEVMDYLANAGIGHTGYTHQARHENFDPRFIKLCMISADSPKQALQWQARGARTFRVAMSGDSMFDSEIECLSETEGTQCADCGLCVGTTNTAKSIAITVHGTWKSSFKTALIATTSVA